jgi:hypothetical protein
MFCTRRLDQQEIKMNASIRAATAIGFILAIPLFAIPALSAPALEKEQKAAHLRVADFAKARAVAIPGSNSTSPQKPGIDGLSRDPGDCAKYGCIDNGGS